MVQWVIGSILHGGPIELFPIPARFFYIHHRQDSTYHSFFITPVVEHWLEREIVQCVHHEGSIRGIVKYLHQCQVDIPPVTS